MKTIILVITSLTLTTQNLASVNMSGKAKIEAKTEATAVVGYVVLPDLTELNMPTANEDERAEVRHGESEPLMASRFIALPLPDT